MRQQSRSPADSNRPHRSSSPSPDRGPQQGTPPRRVRSPALSNMSSLGFLSYLRLPFAISSVIVAGLSGLLYWKQNELIYPRNIPSGARTEVPRPADFPEYDNMHDAEEHFIPTPDGEVLHGYLLKPGNKSAYGRNNDSITILMFHGNAGNIGHRLPVAGVMDINVRCNILMLEYRGYGKSTGTPDEKGLNIDAQAGLDFIRNRQDLHKTKIIVYGQSLGGAVAIQLVARNLGAGDINGMILENTFLSMRKLIPSALPPAKYLASLCHQLWPSDETLPAIDNIPILFLSGEQDEIVPPSHMVRLYELCTAEHKRIRTFPTGTHNNTVAMAGYFDTVSEFIDHYLETRTISTHAAHSAVTWEVWGWMHSPTSLQAQPGHAASASPTGKLGTLGWRQPELQHGNDTLSPLSNHTLAHGVPGADRDSDPSRQRRMRAVVLIAQKKGITSAAMAHRIEQLEDLRNVPTHQDFYERLAAGRFAHIENSEPGQPTLQYIPVPITLKAQLGSPTALAIGAFATTLTTLGCALMGFRGVSTTNAFIGNFLAVAGIGMVITAQWELVLGNTYAYTVLSAFGFFYLGFGFIVTPGFGVADAYGGADTAEYNNAIGLFVLCKLRRCLQRRESVAAFTLVAAGYLVKADAVTDPSKASVAKNLLISGGAFAFASGMLGYYTVANLMCQEALNFNFPMGDTSRFFKRGKRTAAQAAVEDITKIGTSTSYSEPTPPNGVVSKRESSSA
ncbi:hypothetical protein FH972_021000 [Carpinus fangiana]|uniref:AB hydrolase-1 domain-containing protein n=1 Tax=Carpinus fangiana TaxID=176857 RepID=A0A5N6KNM4_9ROSI|nr:hypothetical protein FH972_021000 [Carpinus fangiana]